MISFLEQTLNSIESTYQDLSKPIFILPSQRAVSFLKQLIAKRTNKATFLPEIYSIESFIEKVAGLQQIDNTTTLFKLYEVYISLINKEDQETFETFSGWAQTIIGDFNEIDRYLIPSDEFFNYLSEIKDKDHWYLADEKTTLIENYLKFWKQLPQLYNALYSSLISSKKGYQGLIYREAANNIDTYLSTNNKTHIFIGFNALNNAEQHIIQQSIKKDCAEVFWDLDEVFYNDTFHDASHFIRSYYKNWKVFENKQFNGGQNFSNKKEISIIGTPKKIGQAKAVGQILNDIPANKLSSTAVILGDETLLLPLLNAIPKHIKDVNITMGLPLQKVPLASFFELLFTLQLNNTSELYYKHVLEIFNHPSLQYVLEASKLNVVSYINTGNIVSIKFDSLIAQSSAEESEIVKLLFSSSENNPEHFISRILKIIQYLKQNLSVEQSVLREYLYRFNVLFNKLEHLLSTFSHISNISVLHNIYKDMLSNETLDFIGKKHDGLQIMGVLETRVLDFENIIITSVNEGILPSGKSANSYLPYDLKKEYGLPTYKEKDAIYTYHFYHMLQRCNQAHIIFNTEAGDLNSGEKSRFITQLQVEAQNYPKHSYNNLITLPKVPKITSQLRTVQKTAQVMDQIKYRAKSGFSPSALTLYMRNPIDFYTRYVLGVGDTEEVEETVAYNTLGTVVHDTLEQLYTPYIGELLNADIIKIMTTKADKQVALEFNNTYSKSSLDKGMNLLIFEVAKRYVHNFLKLEKKRLDNGEDIQILKLEEDNNVPITITGIDFPVNLRGKVDRVEKINGITRIIDYKTGNVDLAKVTVKSWDDLNTDYDKYSKSFQILQYAYMMHLKTPFLNPIEAGIISFKNLKSGFLPFNYNKNTEITTETFKAFSKQLEQLIKDICNPNIPFVEKELKDPIKG